VGVVCAPRSDGGDRGPRVGGGGRPEAWLGDVGGGGGGDELDGRHEGTGRRRGGGATCGGGAVRGVEDWIRAGQRRGGGAPHGLGQREAERRQGGRGWCSVEGEGRRGQKR
jgi:hypothetical protein